MIFLTQEYSVKQWVHRENILNQNVFVFGLFNRIKEYMTKTVFKRYIFNTEIMDPNKINCLTSFNSIAIFYFRISQSGQYPTFGNTKVLCCYCYYYKT